MKICQSAQDAFNAVQMSAFRSADRSTAFVYLLFEGDRVVYVGKAEHKFAMFNRISSHICSKKQFDRWKCVRTTQEHVLEIEKSLIKKFEPKYNWVHNRNKKWAELREDIKNAVRRLHKGFTIKALLFAFEIDHPKKWSENEIRNEFDRLRATKRV